jgi:hypothetical protein
MLALARALTIVSLASVIACLQAQDAPPASLAIDDGRASVRGAVRDNVKRCQMDGPCYLTLAADSGNVRVYYNHGEDPPCRNERSTSTGLAVRVGDSIEARGLYSFVDRTHTIDVCCPDCTLTVIERP